MEKHFLEIEADAYVEKVMKDRFDIEVRELEKRLLEMEQIFGNMPELRNRLEILKSDPIGYCEFIDIENAMESHDIRELERILIENK